MKLEDGLYQVKDGMIWKYRAKGGHCKKIPLTGEWIDQDHGAYFPYECSNCHAQPMRDEYGYHLTPCCPFCGSYNGGEADDSNRD